MAKKPPARLSLPPRACHPVRLPAVKLFDYVAGWADSGQERGAALTFTLVQTLSCEPRSSIAAQRCVQCIFLTRCKYRSTTVLVFIFLRKSIPNAMALGRWPFTVLQRARGMAYSFAGPSRGVHRGSGEGACDKTRPHCLCDSLLHIVRLRSNEYFTDFRKKGLRGTCRGCGEKNWKSCMHSAAEKSGRFGVCVCHTITVLQGMEIVVIWTVSENQALKGYVIC